MGEFPKGQEEQRYPETGRCRCHCGDLLWMAAETENWLRRLRVRFATERIDHSSSDIQSA